MRKIIFVITGAFVLNVTKAFSCIGEEEAITDTPVGMYITCIAAIFAFAVFMIKKFRKKKAAAVSVQPEIIKQDLTHQLVFA
jgi:hypothetical protein